VYLELGGKSPNIVFDDVADIDHAAKVSAMGIFRNSGQVCVAGSRLLVQRSIHDALVERICQVAQSLRVGDPLDVRTDIGPLSSARQMQRVQTLLQQADAEGVRRVCGGDPITPVPGGMYMRPAVLADVTPQMTIAQQEVFGPVLAVTPFDTEDEAVALANGTVYGLAAGVWTGNLSRAHRMVRRVRAGVVHVNTYGGPDITVPLGGVRQSGNGHDKSMHALDKYLDLKTAWFQL
jgi:gamma-glutamyl-gamma-aminobutyraldehyde dehydrogenase